MCVYVCKCYKLLILEQMDRWREIVSFAALQTEEINEIFYL